MTGGECRNALALPCASGRGSLGAYLGGEGALFVELTHSICSIAWDVCTLTNLALTWPLMNLFSVIAIHLLHTSTCVVILLTFIIY